MDEFLVYGARVVRSNIARFRKEQQRLRAQGGLSITAGIAAAAGVVDMDDDDAGLSTTAGIAAAAGLIDVDDDDAADELAITEETNGSIDDRKMTMEEAAAYHRTGKLSPHRPLRVRLALVPRRRQWVCRIRHSLVRLPWLARAQPTLAPCRRQWACMPPCPSLSLVHRALLARASAAPAPRRRRRACRLARLSLVRRPLLARARVGPVPRRRAATDERAASSVSRWCVGLCGLGRARLRPCVAVGGRGASRWFVGL